jgi:hypothetical protein
VMKQLGALRLTSFEYMMVDSCMEREEERILSLISPPK